VLGFALAVVCAVALARFGQTDEHGKAEAEAEPRDRPRQCPGGEPSTSRAM
jgi:hypothetical protein